MATPSNVPMSMTRGVSFLPGKLAERPDPAERNVQVERETIDLRIDDPQFRSTRGSADIWGKGKGRRET